MDMEKMAEKIAAYDDETLGEQLRRHEAACSLLTAEVRRRHRREDDE